MKKMYISLAAASILCSGPVFAKEYQLKDIDIVENINTLSLGDIKDDQMTNPYSATASAALSLETFNEDDIEKIKPDNVYDILKNAQSINISFMGRKHPFTISFRGSSSGVGASSFGIILDGALLSDNSAMRILEVLPTEMIESLQVVRDSTALSLAPMQGFGSPNGSTLEGFIVIKTKKPLKNGGGVKLSYESFDTKKANLYYGGVNDDFYFSFAGNTMDTEGEDGFNTATHGGSAFFNMGVKKEDYTFNVEGFFSKYYQEIQKANLPISKFYNTYWKYEPFENRFLNLAFSKNWNPNNVTDLSLSYAKSTWDHNQDTTGATNTYFYGVQKNTSLDIKHTMSLDDNIFKGGAQAIWYDSPNGELFYEGYQRKEQIYGAFVQAEHFISDKLVVDEAIRIDKKHIDTLLERYSPNVATDYGSPMLNNGAVSIIEDTWAKATISGALGALYKYNDTNSFSGKFAYSSNSPLSQITDINGDILDTEKKYKYELGYESVFKKFKTKMNIFYYDIKNLKSPYYTGTAANPVIVFTQYDQQRYGGELSFGGKEGSFDYLLNYAYVKADKKDNEIPNDTLSLSLGYTHNAVSTNLRAKYVGEYESNFFTTDGKYHKVGDFTLLDASIDYSHKLYGYDAVSSLYGKNITDEPYMTKIGWENQGAVLGVSCSLKF